MSLHLLGIRHHGPGCARSVRAALDEIQPDVIVLEAPADAEESLLFAGHEEMKPPVALLLYPSEEPKRGVYYPLAVFSPEWQTLRWAAQHRAPVKAMDLPQAIQLALETKGEEEKRRKREGESKQHDNPNPVVEGPETIERTDPIALLAEAAGYEDHELWWEEQVERRADASGLFAAIAEAMTVLRCAPPEDDNQPSIPSLLRTGRARDLLREAHMRQTIRGVQKEGFKKIAVICGAWHAPVLSEAALAGQLTGCSIKADTQQLKGLAKIKTTATWIPWTHSRLTYRSGYGAGIQAPGWYAHIWKSPQQAPMRWITTAARLLRSSDLDASAASVIETVRLAETLAAMRELRSPGLAELNEAILSVLCHGNQSPLRLIHDRLEIGDVLGQTPKEIQSVPLVRDLEKQQRSLRLKPAPETKTLDLDLRKDIDRSRSHLFHRLDLLGIAWGQLQPVRGKLSTFHELWQLTWKPELMVEVIEASIWGSTLASAASSKALDVAQKSEDLPIIAGLVDKVLLASLDAAIDPVLQRLQNLSARSADVRQLMNALPSLARVARYGDVRGTQSGHIVPVLAGMFERAMVGLLRAVSSLDDDAAEEMVKSLGAVQQALDLLQRNDWETEWQEQLQRILVSNVHGLLRGWSCRMLLEKGKLPAEEFYWITRLALSFANDPLAVAAWMAGLLRGSGMLLLHQEELWQVFDQWLRELPQKTFTEMLPLLRRAFADFSGPERRQMGEKGKHLNTESSPPPSPPPTRGGGFNAERARRVLPVLAQILGVTMQDGKPNDY
jgi:hypothetical protein